MRTRAFEQIVTRVKSEFVEMPGLTLTLEQSSRLWVCSGHSAKQCSMCSSTANFSA